MNTLSWLIYIADVCGSISAAGSMLAVGAGIAGAVLVIGTAFRTDMDNIGAYEKRPIWQTGWQVGKGYFKLGIIAALVIIPVPSKDTIYAIAASEMGERALASPTGDRAVKALNAWLDRQIAREPSK